VPVVAELAAVVLARAAEASALVVWASERVRAAARAVGVVVPAALPA
jgi:hypothetical protein